MPPRSRDAQAAGKQTREKQASGTASRQKQAGRVATDTQEAAGVPQPSGPSEPEAGEPKAQASEPVRTRRKAASSQSGAVRGRKTRVAKPGTSEPGTAAEAEPDAPSEPARVRRKGAGRQTGAAQGHARSQQPAPSGSTAAEPSASEPVRTGAASGQAAVSQQQAAAQPGASSLQLAAAQARDTLMEARPVLADDHSSAAFKCVCRLSSLAPCSRPGTHTAVSGCAGPQPSRLVCSLP